LHVYLELQEQPTLTMWPRGGTGHQSCWWVTPNMEGEGVVCPRQICKYFWFVTQVIGLAKKNVWWLKTRLIFLWHWWVAVCWSCDSTTEQSCVSYWDSDCLVVALSIIFFLSKNVGDKMLVYTITIIFLVKLENMPAIFMYRCFVLSYTVIITVGSWMISVHLFCWLVSKHSYPTLLTKSFADHFMGNCMILGDGN
jgi:hypothetical protein